MTRESCMRLSLGVATLTLVFGATGCVSGPVTCSRDSDCVAGGCYDRECRAICEQDSDCPEDLVCGWASDTQRGCVPRCTDDTTDFGLVCVDGVPISCSGAGAEASCAACGCRRDPATPVCDPEADRCRGPNDVGGACYENHQCVTGNCSGAGSCSVARGEPCDANNCGLCVELADGGTECAQACRTSSDCDSGEICLEALPGDPVQGEFCRTACSGVVGCGGSNYVCRTTIQGGLEYNACYPLAVVQPG